MAIDNPCDCESQCQPMASSVFVRLRGRTSQLTPCVARPSKFQSNFRFRPAECFTTQWVSCSTDTYGVVEWRRADYVYIQFCLISYPRVTLFPLTEYLHHNKYQEGKDRIASLDGEIVFSRMRLDLDVPVGGAGEARR